MQEEIRTIINKAAATSVSFSVEVPGDKTHGDYSTNVALVLAKQAGKNPRELAEEVVAKLRKEKLFKSIEIAGPGFINFFIDDRMFFDAVKKIDKNAGSGKLLKGQKIMVEHTQPNPFKLFHVGHLMNNAIGESISRILKTSGAAVKTASYHGDVGLHVAKAVYALQKEIPLAEAYAYGHKAFEEYPKAKEEILEINKKIYEKSDLEINQLYAGGRLKSLEDFEKMYEQLGSKFDYHFFESAAGVDGKKVVLQHVGNIFEVGENGAIIFAGEKYGLHTRVFLNSDGLPTYEAKEVGLAKEKKAKWSFSSAVTVTANEQDSFFKVTEAAIGKVFPVLEGELKHVSHGLLKLPSGKMSSRTGNVITAEMLIEKVKESIREKSAERNLDDEAIEKIAIGAIKYSILKQSVGSDIIFDFEKSISFEGDSGPYLQYAYVRATSVMQKAKAEKVKPSLKKIPAVASDLEKLMGRFPEAVQKAAKQYNPQPVALYLTELAAEFSGYYAKNKIIDSADEFSPYKVALVEKFSLIMKNGLWLLGINVVEKM
jgi:arginyl-tRNA synthetase